MWGPRVPGAEEHSTEAKGGCASGQPFPAPPLLDLRFGTSQNPLQEWTSVRPGPLLTPTGMPGVLISIPVAPKRVLRPSAPRGDRP